MTTLPNTANGTRHDPPWGLQTPAPAEENIGGLKTTYGHVFQGWPGSPAKLIRHHTASHFPSGSWRDRTSYTEQFYTPNRFSRHTVAPASIHRKHKPHPSELIWPLEPNKSYMIWKPKLDTITSTEQWKAAAPNITQFDKSRWFTTTYDSYFTGQRLQVSKKKMLSSAPEGQQRNGTSNSQRPQTEGPHVASMYRRDFPGDHGRPSTNAKLEDRSWMNIRY